MRRIFTILVLIAVALTVVAPAKAQNLSWSGGVSITEYADAAGISSRINAQRCGRPMGGTSTKMGTLAVLTAHPTMTYEASLSTVGIDSSKVSAAIVTPDGGKTIWVPEFVDGKGFTLALPIGNMMVKTRYKALLPKQRPSDRDKWEEREGLLPAVGLAPGKMSSIEWKLAVKDKRNRLMIVIIPISWTSERKLAMGNDIMVQIAPPGFDNFNDIQAFACLRGFVDPWATPDPAVIARYQMVTTMPGMPVQPASTSASAPEPSVIQLDGVVRSEPTSQPKPVMVPTTLVFWQGESRQVWRDRLVPKDYFRDGQIVEIRRAGELIGAAEAKPGYAGIVDLFIFRGGFPAAGDQIVIAEEVTQ